MEDYLCNFYIKPEEDVVMKDATPLKADPRPLDDFVVLPPVPDLPDNLQQILLLNSMDLDDTRRCILARNLAHDASNAASRFGAQNFQA